jgi:glutaconate CoA-transferase, subunit A
MGIPFMPVRGILGSDYLKVQPRFKVIDDPFSGHQVVAVGAINPDFTLIHAVMADTRGNVLIERRSDVDVALGAAQVAMATVEEVVEAGQLVEDSERRLMSWINFHYLIHAPGGARPTACPGYYAIDEAEIKHYLQTAKDPKAFEAYVAEAAWADGEPAPGRELS